MMYPKITKVAKYLPKKTVTNDELSKIMDTSDDWIQSRTGIKERHIALDESTSDLAFEVAKKLVEDRDVLSIDFIIVATMTSEYGTPSTACLVQGKLGAQQAFAFDVSAACSGFVYALSVAEKLMQSGIYQKGLVIGAEKMSSVLNWQDRRTAVLFGDGAAGVLLENTATTPHFLGERLASDGTRGSSLTTRQNTKEFPNISLKPEEAEFLTMDGKKIFDFVVRDVAKQMKLMVTDIEEKNLVLDYVLPHQANERLLDALSKKTKIPRERFLANVAHYGNTSGASIPLLLADMIDEGTLNFGSGQIVLLTGFGGGLTWGNLLIKL